MPLKCHILDGNYQNFECALSKDRHIIEEPLVLSSCGHSVCKACLPNVGIEDIKCKICNGKTEMNLVINEKSDLIESSIKANIESLFRLIEFKMDQSIAMASDIYASNKEKINLKIEFVKEEVEIKIESIKIELENLNKKFIERLEVLRNELLGNEDEINGKIEFSETVLNNIRHDIENKTNRSKEKLYGYQHELTSLNMLIENLSSSSFDLSFAESNIDITDDIIGDLHYFIREPVDYSEIQIKLKESSVEEITLNTEPNDMCILPNGLLAIANSTQKNITIFNRDLMLLKTIEKLDDKAFHPLRLTTDDKNRVYITEFSSYQVIMTDLNFNAIKCVGSKGSGEEQFDYPNGICFFHKKLYICDSENKRLQVLSNDLKFETAIPLEYEPWIIKISPERVVCITQFDKAGIYFYDFDTFTLRCKYNDHGYGRISEISSYFIESCKSNSKIYCYDKEGYLIEEIDAKRLGSCINSTADGIMVNFNRQILVSSSSEKKLLKFI